MLIIIFCVGFIAGVGLAGFALSSVCDGKLIVSRDSAGEGPYFFLELEENPNELARKKKAVFKLVRKE